MGQTVGDYLLERLRAWDVRHVFGYPGDGINGILAAWGRADNEPQFIQARHEEMAAFEAVGYAKFTGRVGVCAATSGPGAIHLLNGLYDAKLDHVPVVAIVGQTSRSAMGGSYQQEVDLLSLFKDVASEYVQMVTVPEQLPNVLDRAVRVALAERAPAAVIIPSDVQELAYTAPAHAFKMVPSSIGTDWPVPAPGDAAVARAAEVLNAGSKVAILAGQGARGARRELEEVAELLGAGVAKPLLGKDVLSDELPYVTGAIGLLGTRPSYELMMNCDTLLTVGSNFPYTQFLPEFGQARGVQIDIDGKFIGMRYPYEVNLVGDAAATLRALIPLLKRQEDRSWRESIEARVDRWWRSMDAEAEVAADPVNPMLPGLGPGPARPGPLRAGRIMFGAVLAGRDRGHGGHEGNRGAVRRGRHPGRHQLPARSDLVAGVRPGRSHGGHDRYPPVDRHGLGPAARPAAPRRPGPGCRRGPAHVSQRPVRRLLVPPAAATAGR